MKKSILKFGTDSATREDLSGQIVLDLNMLQDLGEVIKTKRETGDKIALVMSGAVALGRKVKDLSHMKDLVLKERMQAGMGQPILINQIATCFQIPVAQVLVDQHTDSDWHETVNSYLDELILAVLNNNDPISPNELQRVNGGNQIGDNDETATRAGINIEADELLCGTGVQGVINPQNGEIIKKIKTGNLSNEEIEQLCHGKSATGRGGMKQKLRHHRDFVQSSVGRTSGIFFGKDPQQILKFGTSDFQGTTITQ